MPGIRFASRFGSLQVSAIGYSNSESLYVMSGPIISRTTKNLVVRNDKSASNTIDNVDARKGNS